MNHEGSDPMLVFRSCISKGKNTILGSPETQNILVSGKAITAPHLWSGPLARVKCGFGTKIQGVGHHGLLTGHNNLSRHLTVMRLTEDLA